MSAPRTIRPLAEPDIAALRAIDNAAHHESWSPRTFQDELELQDRTHLVAEVDGELVGHVALWADGPCCRVTNVAVSPEHAGRGHASALLLGALQQALATTPVAYIQLEVRPTNRRAQRLYSRFGFIPVGVERNFYDRGDALGNRDAVVMAVPDVCAESWRTRLEQIDLEQTEADHVVADQSNAGATA